jgi:[ribosomal protein S18]-alanine N-acetyltransferase
VALTPIRDARPGDIAALLALEAVCYPPAEAFTREVYAHALGGARAVNLAAEEAGAIVAFVGAFHHKRWRLGHVYTLNVDPQARRRGLASALMIECERRLAELGMRRVALEVNVENAAGIALYEKLGYVRVQLLEDYYSGYPNKDGWLYEKDLTPSRSAAAPR